MTEVKEPQKSKPPISFEIIGIILMAILVIGGFAVNQGLFGKAQTPTKPTPPPPNPYNDYNAPTGRILKPATGDVVKSKKVDIEVEAQDDKSGVAKVEVWAYYLAEKKWEKLSTLTNAPYRYTWNIASLKDQAVSLTTHIFDTAGNEAQDPGGWQEAILLLPSEAK